MHEAITRMLAQYESRTVEDYVRALREILQEIALLGLWRSKFFEKSAFYGGTALRVLYGLDRFSEDLDFTLLTPNHRFDMSFHTDALQRELNAFGFNVHIEVRQKTTRSAAQSAFLKARTAEQLLSIDTPHTVARQIPRGQVTKIRLAVDTDPPPGFDTETKFLLTPIPFSVRTVAVPDLFAGKMHAALCRRWKTRVKGRDWYDLVWFVTYHPALHLSHLEARMRQTGDWKGADPLTPAAFLRISHDVIDGLDIEQVKREVEPFVKSPEKLDVWSTRFFHDLVSRIQFSEAG